MNLPNKLTMFRIFMIPVFMLLLIFKGATGGYTAPVGIVQGTTVSWLQVIAMVVFAVASATDWLDGHIARARGLVTNFGKFADPLADKMLTMTAFIFLVALNLAPAWVVAIIVCRELAVTGLRLIVVENDGEVVRLRCQVRLKLQHKCSQLFSYYLEIHITLVLFYFILH